MARTKARPRKISRSPTRVYSDFYEVMSSSRPDLSYVVARRHTGEWACSCPRWIFNTPRIDCKHIKQVLSEVAGQPTPIQVVHVNEVTAAAQKTLSRFSLVELA